MIPIIQDKLKPLPSRSGSSLSITTLAKAGESMKTPGDADKNISNSSVFSGKTSLTRGIVIIRLLILGKNSNC